MKAIVSGHSRGLGAAIAADLLVRGVAVMGLARRPNTVLQARFPQLLVQQALDLADTAALLEWLQGPALRDFLGTDDGVVLVNNAGVVHPVGALAQLEPAAIAAAVAINVSAPLMLASALAAHPCRERRILHVSSGAGRDAYAGWGVYCATKAALDHHARATAQEHRPGLRICSVAPGVIDTDMQAELRAATPDRFALREQFHALQRDGHLETPEDCAARLVAFLLAAQFGATPVAALR